MQLWGVECWPRKRVLPGGVYFRLSADHLASSRFGADGHGCGYSTAMAAPRCAKSFLGPAKRVKVCFLYHDGGKEVVLFVRLLMGGLDIDAESLYPSTDLLENEDFAVER